MKAEDLVNLIRRKYPLDRPDGRQSHVVLEQVPDGTGTYLGHWIDAVVFSLWASKGLTRAAFEVKVTRSDFISELQNPLKHKWALDCFHELWFVAPQDVIQLEELPPNIGWLCPRGSKLVTKRQAVRNPNPKLDDVLLAAFMRAASKEITKVSRTSATDILENSEEYRKAKVYQDAITQFINQRGNTEWLDPKTTDDVIKWLDDATMDKQLKQDREHLIGIASHFQREIVSMLNLFLIIANKSLISRDNLVKHIVSAYGGHDDDSIEMLKGLAQDSKALDIQRRYAETVELIVNWDREFKEKVIESRL